MLAKRKMLIIIFFITNKFKRLKIFIHLCPGYDSEREVNKYFF